MGNLYGATKAGGNLQTPGTVYEIVAGSNSITPLTSFNGTNGTLPENGVLVDGAGNVYGTAYGGADNDGIVFEVAAGSNNPSTIASFTGTNGQYPLGLIVDSAGNFYGTTQSGGTNNDGTIFEIASGSSTITTLASFDGTNGSQPETALTLDSNGDIFGTTSQGGDNNIGTVFEMAAGSQTITTIFSLDAATTGQFANGLTLDSSGDIYGTTADYGGGQDPNTGQYASAGTLFELMPTGSAGAPEPSALLLLAPGALGFIAARRACRAANVRRRCPAA
jgi:uncharacterized repeat protein (TIGR03803 family)